MHSNVQTSPKDALQWSKVTKRCPPMFKSHQKMHSNVQTSPEDAFQCSNVTKRCTPMFKKSSGTSLPEALSYRYGYSHGHQRRKSRRRASKTPKQIELYFGDFFGEKELPKRTCKHIDDLQHILEMPVVQDVISHIKKIRLPDVIKYLSNNLNTWKTLEHRFVQLRGQRLRR
ncbi:hypothetical protein CHS0354_009775 [Potamilus streckersoni]|uniref:Uncharacterized protein n=1 Tax=Potamilus streckersoni TaxID=2493646 RepID=A0AAE0SUX9_9BIVA|nr:hypothetical protein CHS0354_009775 [Potamilus streckersoni]